VSIALDDIMDQNNSFLWKTTCTGNSTNLKAGSNKQTILSLVTWLHCTVKSNTEETVETIKI
jgi:hypothetical protein